MSAFHRLRSDEARHFYAGNVLTIFLLGADGGSTMRLGTDVSKGEQSQFVVPAGSRIAARVQKPGA